MASFFCVCKAVGEPYSGLLCVDGETARAFFLRAGKGRCSAYKKEVPGGLVCGRLRTDAHVAQEFLYLRMAKIVLVKRTAV